MHTLRSPRCRSMLLCVRTLLLTTLLALVACGGGDFRAGAEAQAGAPPETGGTSGAGGAGDAGSSGAVSDAGAAGELGAGAPQAGSGGARGGDAGAAGLSAGAGGGAGAPEPTCSPADAIVFPESFSWDGFAARWDDVDQSYCSHSDGGECRFRNVELTVSEEVMRVGIYANMDCAAQFYAGICGSERACTGTLSGGPGPGTRASLTFDIVPEGAGYRLIENTGRLANFEGRDCYSQTTDGTDLPVVNESFHDVQADFFALIEGMFFSCP